MNLLFILIALFFLFLFLKKNIKKKATYALWHPKGYEYYKTNLNKLSDKYPDIAPLFPRSIMPSISFNLSNCITTKKHIDSQNCSFGWCLVTALGNFDATKGGHLVLWEIGLILKFPAGACICLPSAHYTFQYSNKRI
jgi:hypothetical protein